MAQRSENTQARQFDLRAGTYLSSLGFNLVADPDESRGAYLQSHALYRSDRGLFLMIWFQPTDGSGAGITCGRRWDAQSESIGRKWYVLSNCYSRLAKRFGFDLPESYPLGYGVSWEETVEAILHDLRKTLPLILKKVELDDLIGIERDTGGAEERVVRAFGWNQIKNMKVSEYRDFYGTS